MFIQARANGTIYPSRFVSVYPSTSATADSFKVIEDIVAAQPIIGVSQEGTTGFPMGTNDMGVTAPTYAASDEQDLKVYGPGEVCLIELGGTVNAGDPLKANATTDGKGVAADITTASQQFIGGYALQYGISGDKIRMLIHPGIINNGT
jgi:hypothetical protein